MMRLGPFGQEHIAHHDLLDEGSRDAREACYPRSPTGNRHRAQAALDGAHGQPAGPRFGHHRSRALSVTRLFGMYGRQRAQDGQRDHHHPGEATLLTHVRSRGLAAPTRSSRRPNLSTAPGLSTRCGRSLGGRDNATVAGGLDTQRAKARLADLNGDRALVDPHCLAPQPRCHRECGGAARIRVEHQIAGVGTRLHQRLEQRLWFLRRISGALFGYGGDDADLPYIAERRAR